MHRCSGPNRRQFLQVGVSAFGLSLTRLLRAEAAETARPGRAKAVVVLYLSGGPSQLDMWDPKPQAPADIRGSFKAIPTTVPGLLYGEHLPKMAQRAHLCTTVHSMTHEENDHLRAGHYVLTGAELPRKVPRSGMQRTDRPHFGGVVGKFLGGRSAVPPFVTIPEWVAPVGPPRPGQHAGFLGAAFDPYLIDSDPNEADYNPGSVQVTPGSRAARTDRLRALLAAAERHGKLANGVVAADEYRTFREKALDLIASPQAQQAFDIGRETAATRDRYGRHHFGQSALVARRLIEAGTRVVQINFIRHDDGKGGQGYDSHASPGYPKHEPWLKDELLPPTDAAFAALVDDLQDRGLLDETIVVIMGEFGRTPRFNKEAGRDHWAQCYSLVVAGGGFARGRVHGASDATTTEPTDSPVRPEDLLATVYHQLGIEPEALIHDVENRPWPVVEGKVVPGLLA